MKTKLTNVLDSRNINRVITVDQCVPGLKIEYAGIIWTVLAVFAEYGYLEMDTVYKEMALQQGFVRGELGYTLAIESAGKRKKTARIVGKVYRKPDSEIKALEMSKGMLIEDKEGKKKVVEKVLPETVVCNEVNISRRSTEVFRFIGWYARRMRELKKCEKFIYQGKMFDRGVYDRKKDMFICEASDGYINEFNPDYYVQTIE